MRGARQGNPTTVIEWQPRNRVCEERHTAGAALHARRLYSVVSVISGKAAPGSSVTA